MDQRRENAAQQRRCLATCAWIVLAVPAVSAGDDGDAVAPALRLGKRLYLEKRFTNPASNFAANCYACHRPEWAPEGRRAYSDALRYSLIPTDSFGNKRTTLRNAPSLMDVAGHVRFGHDGRFASLQEAIAAEFTSPHLGWLAEEREAALDEIHVVLLSDGGVDQIAEGTYIEQFKKVYDVDLTTMTRDQTVGWVVKCLADYVASFNSTRTSAFDAFAAINGLPLEPPEGISAAAFGKSLLSRLSGERVQSHEAFGREAFEGLKIFLETSGKARTGNCVVCHTPPQFTDASYYNTGVAQAEYDARHGVRAFAGLGIPTASTAQRPDKRFGPKLKDGKQVNADLGYWNYVDASDSESPRGNGAARLKTALGAFKAPTLRNLKYTDPYMHNGAYSTLEEAIAQKVKACALAKAGALRSGDPALAVMNITENDIGPLVAFLATLNDVSAEQFAAYRQETRPLAEADENP